MANQPEQSQEPKASGLMRHDFTMADVWGLLAGAVVTGVILILAAYDVRPFGDGFVVTFVSGVLVVLLHASVAAAVTGLVIEWRHPEWTFLHRRHHIAMAVALGVIGLAVGFLDWWVLGQGLGAARTVAYVFAAVVGLVLGVVVSGLVASPNHLRDGGEQPALVLSSITLGAVAAVVTSIALIGGIAFVRNHRHDQRVANPPLVHLQPGTYVASATRTPRVRGCRRHPLHGRRPAPPTAPAVTGRGRPTRSGSGSTSQPAVRFAACSGAVAIDATRGYDVPQRDGSTVRVEPQIDGVHPEVGLVTMTMGGNDVLFFRIVLHCLTHDDCMERDLRPSRLGASLVRLARSRTAGPWAIETRHRARAALAALDEQLRAELPERSHRRDRIPVPVPGRARRLPAQRLRQRAAAVAQPSGAGAAAGPAGSLQRPALRAGGRRRAGVRVTRRRLGRSPALRTARSVHQRHQADHLEGRRRRRHV